MDFLKKFFPFSFKPKEITKDFVLTIVLYAVVAVVGGVVLGLLSGIRFIGFFFGIAGYLLGVYCTGGIVLAILHKVGVIK